jgi:hypothetical protein
MKYHRQFLHFFSFSFMVYTSMKILYIAGLRTERGFVGKSQKTYLEAEAERICFLVECVLWGVGAPFSNGVGGRLPEGESPLLVFVFVRFLFLFLLR